MIIPDINVLVYAYDQSSQYHLKSRAWWQSAVGGAQPIGLPWAVILGFTRISTNKRMYRNAISVVEALLIVDDWLTFPQVSILDPGSRHWLLMNELSVQAKAANTKLVSDIHLAAIAIEHRATLVTNDRDFQQFSGLRTYNPL